MADRVGTRIAGYRIESLLSRGGMGEVFLAEQDAPKRKVALKLLAPELSEDPGFRERFARESEAAASIDHPNVIPIYQSGSSDGALFIAMRYVEGTDLRTLLSEQGAQRIERAVVICAQIADALEAAHERGLVHRDVKPANILVGRNDHAYLSDFGLIRGSQVATGITKTGQFMGTIDYAAPEQIKGEAVDGRADIYSLGCVLYECLTGVRPFSRETEVATLYAHLQDTPPVPSALNPSLPPGLDEVAAHAMAKDRNDRYASAMELATDLRRESPSMQREPLVKETRPNRSRKSFALLAATLVVLAIGIALWVGNREAVTPRSTKKGGTGGLDTASIAEVDPATDSITGSASDDFTGWHIVADQGALWEAGPDGLTKRSASTGKYEDTIDVGGEPHVVAGGFDAIWVTVESSGGEAHLAKVNAATDEVIDRVDVSAQRNNDIIYVATDKNFVWVLNGEGSLWKIDPLHTKVIKKYSITGTGTSLTTGGGYVWVSDVLNREIFRVDPTTGKADATEVSIDPDQVAYLDGQVWVEDRDGRTVTPIDAVSLTPGQPVGIPDGPAFEVPGLGSMWIATEGGVARIDPATFHETPISLPFQISNCAPDPTTGLVWALRQPSGWGPPGSL